MFIFVETPYKIDSKYFFQQTNKGKLKLFSYLLEIIHDFMCFNSSFVNIFYIRNYLATTAHSKNISYSCYATRFVLENKVN